MIKHLQLYLLISTIVSCGERSTKNSSEKNIDSISKPNQTLSKKSEDVLKWNRDNSLDKIILRNSIAKYITKGYEPLDTASGDINGDNISDLLLVTSIINEDSIRYESTEFKRELLLLLGQNDGSYKLYCRNTNAIPCINCCGMTDPFGGISIMNGQIVILEYCASNCKAISEFSFKYSQLQKTWFLEKVIKEFYCFDYENYSRDTTMLKDFGKIAINKFDIETNNKW